MSLYHPHLVPVALPDAEWRELVRHGSEHMRGPGPAHVTGECHACDAWRRAAELWLFPDAGPGRRSPAALQTPTRGPASAPSCWPTATDWAGTLGLVLAIGAWWALLWVAT